MGPLGKPGASLRVWKDFFPIAEIYGADIDRSILFSEPRIKTGFMDQTEPTSIHRFWHDFDISDFDLMVDDGLHTFHAGTTLFENSINRLSVSGIYVIEDVKSEDIIRYMNYFKTKPYNVEYVFLSNTVALRSDNNLVVIRNLADYHGVSPFCDQG